MVDEKRNEITAYDRVCARRAEILNGRKEGLDDNQEFLLHLTTALRDYMGWKKEWWTWADLGSGEGLQGRFSYHGIKLAPTDGIACSLLLKTREKELPLRFEVSAVRMVEGGKLSSRRVVTVSSMLQISVDELDHRSVEDFCEKASKLFADVFIGTAWAVPL